MGEFARFKKGHNSKYKNHNFYGKTGSLHPGWKGGKSNQGEYITLYKPYFKYCDKNGYVRKHRYIMYLYLSILNGKPTYIEGLVVHHKNRIKDDNRIENLELLTLSEHNIEHNKDKKFIG